MNEAAVFVDGVIYQLQSVGGINTYFDELLPRVAASGAAVTLLTPPLRPHAGPCGSPGIARRRRRPLSGIRGAARLPGAALKAVRELERCRWARKIDATDGAVFHSTYYTTLPLRNAPAVVTVYDMIHEQFQRFFNTRDDDSFRTRKRACVVSARRTIAISETTKADLCAVYELPPDDVDVVPLAVDGDFWSRCAGEEFGGKPGRPAGLRDPYLLYVGARDGHKNFRTLLEGYARWAANREVMLGVVGSEFNPDERERIGAFGLTGRVRALGRMPDAELARAYAASAAFVYPSLYEGFGLPLLEAMACGAPVAAARAGSIPEVVADAAELFDPSEPDAIAFALANVTEPRRAEQLRAAGTERVRHFSWDRTAELTLASYRLALDGRND